MINDSPTFLTEARLWGQLTVTDSGAGYCVKRLRIAAGGMHSLHRHRHRDEHWVVVVGKARVTLEGKDADVDTGGHVYVKAGAAHRIGNPGTSDLIVVEVQTGSVISERDIERLEPGTAGQ